jgi:hypothetical protein
MGKSIALAVVCGLAALIAANGIAFAQAGSTGGTLGKTDKSASGGRSHAHTVRTISQQSVPVRKLLGADRGTTDPKQYSTQMERGESPGALEPSHAAGNVLAEWWSLTGATLALLTVSQSLVTETVFWSTAAWHHFRGDS